MRKNQVIAIAGAGYVGLTSAACFCEMGHRVALVEVDQERLASLRNGECPIFEPGLPQLLTKHLGGLLTVTDSLAEGASNAAALFACVGTPPRAGGAPNLTALKHLLRDIRRLGEAGPSVLVLKSTVPPGTCRMAYEFLGRRIPVVSNPEFLREGLAIEDFFHPDRIVVGSPDAAAAMLVAGLYVGLDSPLLVTGWEESELVEYVTSRDAIRVVVTAIARRRRTRPLRRPSQSGFTIIQTKTGIPAVPSNIHPWSHRPACDRPVQVQTFERYSESF